MIFVMSVERRVNIMSKVKKGDSARPVIKIGSKKKQRTELKILLRNIADDYNQSIKMRGLGDTGHLAGQW